MPTGNTKNKHVQEISNNPPSAACNLSHSMCVASINIDNQWANILESNILSDVYVDHYFFFIILRYKIDSYILCLDKPILFQEVHNDHQSTCLHSDMSAMITW